MSRMRPLKILQMPGKHSLTTLRTIKIIRRSKDPQKLRFVPLSTADYDEQEYPTERIRHVFEVIGSVSKFF